MNYEQLRRSVLLLAVECAAGLWTVPWSLAAEDDAADEATLLAASIGIVTDLVACGHIELIVEDGARVERMMPSLAAAAALNRLSYLEPAKGASWIVMDATEAGERAFCQAAETH